MKISKIKEIKKLTKAIIDLKLNPSIKSKNTIQKLQQKINNICNR